ncbi:MAG: CPBP family intramembrane glutamic endopeptidase [Gammaproteobacteria bacterium]|nr:CPBP family intramembrane glutamic endopeptidase [Gammaproteobacteria bacterium]
MQPPEAGTGIRARTFRALTEPAGVLKVLALCTVATLVAGGVGYLLGLLVVLTAFWASGFRGREFGIGRPHWPSTLARALGYALGLFLVGDLLVQPLLEHWLGRVDLQALGFVEGNLSAALMLLALMWVTAAFGEELVYRGYFMLRLARMLGDDERAWWVAALLVSALFGLAHAYPGPAGVVGTGFVGLVLALIFLRHRTNLILVMLVHGFYDTIGIVLLYAGRERTLVEWIRSLFG